MGLAEEALPNFSEEEKMDIIATHNKSLGILRAAGCDTKHTRMSGEVRISTISVPYVEGDVVMASLLTGRLSRMVTLPGEDYKRYLSQAMRDAIELLIEELNIPLAIRVVTFPTRDGRDVYVELILQTNSDGVESVISFMGLVIKYEQPEAAQKQGPFEVKVMSAIVDSDDKETKKRLAAIAHQISLGWDAVVLTEAPTFDGSTAKKVYIILRKQSGQ